MNKLTHETNRNTVIFYLSGKREQIDVNLMTNSYNTQDTFLTTASSEICLTVVWGSTICGVCAAPRRIIIGEIRYLDGTRFRVESLASSHRILSVTLSRSLSLPLFRSLSLALPLSRVPVLLYGRYVIIEMSSCRCFDNPITRAFA